MRDRLLAAGAASVASVVLLDKKARRKVDFVPDYIGMDCPNHWVAGEGAESCMQSPACAQQSTTWVQVLLRLAVRAGSLQQAGSPHRVPTSCLPSCPDPTYTPPPTPAIHPHPGMDTNHFCPGP